MVIHCSSTRYIWEVLENEEYRFWNSHQVVIDAGCNIGTFSIYMQPHAEIIYAIDCVQDHLDNLNKTIKDNNYQNIKTYNFKLGNVSGFNKQTLREFMDGQVIKRVNLLKLDIEGDEKDVVNCDDFPSNRIDRIIGEYHYDGVAAENFRDRVRKLGYEFIEYPNKHFLAIKV